MGQFYASGATRNWPSGRRGPKPRGRRQFGNFGRMSHQNVGSLRGSRVAQLSPSTGLRISDRVVSLGSQAGRRGSGDLRYNGRCAALPADRGSGPRTELWEEESAGQETYAATERRVALQSRGEAEETQVKRHTPQGRADRAGPETCAATEQGRAVDRSAPFAVGRTPLRLCMEQ